MWSVRRSTPLVTRPWTLATRRPSARRRRPWKVALVALTGHVMVSVRAPARTRRQPAGLSLLVAVFFGAAAAGVLVAGAGAAAAGAGAAPPGRAGAGEPWPVKAVTVPSAPATSAPPPAASAGIEAP